MFRLVMLAAVLAPLFGGKDPVRGRPWYHADMTWQAAEAAGWTTGDGRSDESTAAAALAWHADYVDSYLYNPLWWAAGGVTRFRAALLHRDALVNLHFDDLTSARQVQLVWSRYQAGTVAGLLWAADHDDVAAARNVVGAGVHALQDFYSHSNWVDDPARRTRTWAEAGPEAGSVADPRDALHLHSGAYERPVQGAFKPHGKYVLDCSVLRQLPAPLMNAMFGGNSPLQNTSIGRRWHECQEAVASSPETVLGFTVPENVLYVSPPGIALDSPWLAAISAPQRDLPDRDEVTSDELFTAALTLATRHTAGWLRQLDAVMRSAGLQEFWTRVTTEPRAGQRHNPGPDALESLLGGYDGDIAQYEERWRTPFAFLSSGTYPPDPDGADEGWFLRLDISTAGDALAGTDADIHADVDGTPFLLDHMRRRTHHGGPGETRILEHNDFEAGGRDTYVVGPFAQRPAQLALRNSAASGKDVLLGAWKDLVRFSDGVFDDLRTALLSVIAGNADLVGTARLSWSWDDLSFLAQGKETGFLLPVRGHGEGDYDIHGRITGEATSEGLRVTVATHTLHCIQESKGVLSDRGSWADEPFVIMLVSSPAAGTTMPWRSEPFGDVDDGERRELTHVVTVDVPRYGGIIVSTQIWESDDESSDDRDRLRDDYARGYDQRTVNERSQFLDALGRAVAPDWKPARLDAYAFRRGPVVEVAHLVDDRAVDTWVGAGETLAVPLDAAPTRTVALPA